MASFSPMRRHKPAHISRHMQNAKIMFLLRWTYTFQFFRPYPLQGEIAWWMRLMKNKSSMCSKSLLNFHIIHLQSHTIAELIAITEDSSHAIEGLEKFTVILIHGEYFNLSQNETCECSLSIWICKLSVAFVTIFYNVGVSLQYT